MAKELIDLKQKLRQYRFQHNFLQKIDCSKEEAKEYKKLMQTEQSLPENVYQNTFDNGAYMNGFYRIHESDLTEQEKQDYIMYKQIEYLKSIKNSMVFFVVLAIISMTGAFVLLNGIK